MSERANEVEGDSVDHNCGPCRIGGTRERSGGGGGGGHNDNNNNDDDDDDDGESYQGHGRRVAYLVGRSAGWLTCTWRKLVSTWAPLGGKPRGWVIKRLLRKSESP